MCALWKMVFTHHPLTLIRPPSWRIKDHNVFLCLVGIIRIVIWTRQQEEFLGGEKFSSCQPILFVSVPLSLSWYESLFNLCSSSEEFVLAFYRDLRTAILKFSKDKHSFLIMSHPVPLQDFLIIFARVAKCNISVLCLCRCIQSFYSSVLSFYQLSSEI